MEFAELIKISRVDNVRLRRPAEATVEVTVAVTGHHLILSIQESDREEGCREIWLLHRGMASINKEHESSRTGTICVKYKDFRIFYLDIIGQEKLQALVTTLEQLAAVSDPVLAYPFFYNPGFKALEDGWVMFRPEEEFKKMLKHWEADWRTSKINQDFSACPSYARAVVVPSQVTDQQIAASARARGDSRFPVLCHIQQDTGVPLLRAAQLTGAVRRCAEDEKIFSAVVGIQRKGFILQLSGPVPGPKADENHYIRWKKVTSRLAGRAELRESLGLLANACNDPNNEKWLSKLASTGWLSHVKDAMNAGCLAAQCLDQQCAPVLVQDSGGQDACLVVSSVAQVILNPDARTLHGFEALVEREWIQAGHPFWTRSSNVSHSLAMRGQQGQQSAGEPSPTFLLFLDCVHQIYQQFPCSFEFTEKFLVLLADQSHASSFGTFLCDNEKERIELGVKDHTVSLWSYINQVEVLAAHINSLYQPNPAVIWPSVAPMSLVLWGTYYLRWVQDQGPSIAQQKKITEIIQRNQEAKIMTQRLKREVLELQELAVTLGLIDLENADSPLEEDLDVDDGSVFEEAE